MWRVRIQEEMTPQRICNFKRKEKAVVSKKTQPEKKEKNLLSIRKRKRIDFQGESG